MYVKSLLGLRPVNLRIFYEVEALNFFVHHALQWLIVVRHYIRFNKEPKQHYIVKVL